MDYSRATLTKHSRPAASASATSRKNKLQRCSICGGLGHKSRTCDQMSVRTQKSQDLSDCLSGSGSPERCSPVDFENTITDARAAYVLLNIAAETAIDISTRAATPEPPVAPPPPEVPAPPPVVEAPPPPQIMPPPPPPLLSAPFPLMQAQAPAPAPPQLLPSSLNPWQQYQFAAYSRQLLMA